MARPAKSQWTQLKRLAQTHPGQRKRVPQTQPDLNRTAVRGASQCRKGSCRETPALALLSRGIRPHPCPKILILLNLSWRRELNPRPSDYKSDALPTELRQHCSNRAKLSYRQSNCKPVSTRRKPLASRALIARTEHAAMPYCAAGFANCASSTGRLWCTSAILIANTFPPLVW
jgi:hypothetical protein